MSEEKTECSEQAQRCMLGGCGWGEGRKHQTVSHGLQVTSDPGLLRVRSLSRYLNLSAGF